MDGKRKARRITFIIGFVFALSTIVGVFSPWVSSWRGIPPYVVGTENATGWEVAMGSVEFGNLVQEQSMWPLIALAAGLLALVICVLGAVRGSRYLGIPLMFGGILACTGALWALGIGQANIYIDQSPEYITAGQGVLDCFIGGGVDLVCGIVIWFLA